MKIDFHFILFLFYFKLFSLFQDLKTIPFFRTDDKTKIDLFVIISKFTK